MRWIAFWVLLVATGVAVFLVGFVPGTNPHVIRTGKAVAARHLKDPDAARFRNLRVGRLKAGPLKGKVALCGEANGKNINGAYVGFSRFIAAPQAEEVLFQPTVLSTEEQQVAASATCEASSAQRRKEGSYFSAYKALSDCEDAKRITEEQLEVAQFNASWEAICR